MRMLAVVFALLPALCLTLATAGCGSNATGSHEQSMTDSTVFTIRTVDNGEPLVFSADDQQRSLDELKVSFTSMKPGDIQSIQFQVVEPNSSTVDTRGIGVWKYWADIRWDWGYVPGCVHTNAWHLNLHLRDRWANRELLNIHMASWWENGPQFGIYNSGARQFCAQSRGTFTAIRGTLTDFFKHAAGMPDWAASPMAYSVAVVCVVCLPFLIWA